VNNGDWAGTKLTNLFEHGAFADFNQLLLVDSAVVPVEDRRAIANKVTTAITINTAWR
jgi:hypothetical protein